MSRARGRRADPFAKVFGEAPVETSARGHRTALYPTQCGGCGLAIPKGGAIVPRPHGGYQHPSCASGADDA